MFLADIAESSCRTSKICPGSRPMVWFVEDQHLGSVQDSLCETNALAHPLDNSQCITLDRSSIDTISRTSSYGLQEFSPGGFLPYTSGNQIRSCRYIGDCLCRSYKAPLLRGGFQKDIKATNPLFLMRGHISSKDTHCCSFPRRQFGPRKPTISPFFISKFKLERLFSGRNPSLILNMDHTIFSFVKLSGSFLKHKKRHQIRFFDRRLTCYQFLTA